MTRTFLRFKAHANKGYKLQFNWTNRFKLLRNVQIRRKLVRTRVELTMHLKPRMACHQLKFARCWQLCFSTWMQVPELERPKSKRLQTSLLNAASGPNVRRTVHKSAIQIGTVVDSSGRVALRQRSSSFRWSRVGVMRIEWFVEKSTETIDLTQISRNYPESLSSWIANGRICVPLRRQ